MLTLGIGVMVLAIIQRQGRAGQHDQIRSHSFSPFRRPGDYGGVAAPDPIPNSAVKRPSADGTSSQDVGE